mmetsp:Transcript_40755/g.95641  ORF Transcript_40755/g.95641 Transcript_40755/m.95641 type:complete len:150 (-) Transcript_40755:930-1379(-)
MVSLFAFGFILLNIICLYKGVSAFSCFPNVSLEFSRTWRKSAPSNINNLELPEVPIVEKKYGARNPLIKKNAKEIAFSFESTQFLPAWWSRNNHFQTIVGALFRGKTLLPSHDINNPYVDENYSMKWDNRKRLETPDGDFFCRRFRLRP